MRECALGFGDKVCIYRIEEEFCDRFFTIGLQSVKEPPVEAKQPRFHCFTWKQKKPECLDIFERAINPSFRVFLADIGAFVEVFFAFSHSKSELQ